jgi:2-polyprenyl-3-methyl-5-hydroxy-6-metoxy-1,4-benzoquinol methylase
VRCAACRTLFSDVDEFEYVEAQHNVWHDGELRPDTVAFYGEARGLAHERFLAANPTRGDGRLLDVGCGLGYFVERALDVGWNAYGCDTSAAWVERARQRVGASRALLGSLEEALPPYSRFDLITTWDVLEHVHDPIPFLREIARRLAPGGRLFIRTPNEAWVYPTYGVRKLGLKEPVELGPLNHVVYYRSSTLRRALAAARLRPIAWPVYPPPQVGYGNRDASATSKRTAVTIVKNAHAAMAGSLASISRGRLVLSSDLDVIADAEPAY